MLRPRASRRLSASIACPFRMPHVPEGHEARHTDMGARAEHSAAARGRRRAGAGRADCGAGERGGGAQAPARFHGGVRRPAAALAARPRLLPRPRSRHCALRGLLQVVRVCCLRLSLSRSPSPSGIALLAVSPYRRAAVLRCPPVSALPRSRASRASRVAVVHEAGKACDAAGR